MDLGYAESDDGVNWVEHSLNPILQAEMYAAVQRAGARGLRRIIPIGILLCRLRGAGCPTCCHRAAGDLDNAERSPVPPTNLAGIRRRWLKSPVREIRLHRQRRRGVRPIFPCISLAISVSDATTCCGANQLTAIIGGKLKKEKKRNCVSDECEIDFIFHKVLLNNALFM